jgi:hypothetical protein
MKKVCVFLSLITITASSVCGQSISDQLLVAECSFRYYNGPTELVILDQMITTRAVASAKPELNSSTRAYHIEFTYKGDEITLQGARVEFLDDHKRPLHAINLKDASHYMKVDTLGHRPNPRSRYVAINLQGIPLQFLDEVISIRIFPGK